MDPVRTEIARHTENARVGDAAAADTIGRLEHRDPAASGGDLPRRRDAGGAGADNHHIDLAGAGNSGHGRQGGRTRGRGEKRTAAQLRHGFQMLAGAAEIAEKSQQLQIAEPGPLTSRRAGGEPN